MLKRTFWFTTGATAGFGGAMWVRRQVLRTVQRYTPEQVQADVTDVGPPARHRPARRRGHAAGRPWPTARPSCAPSCARAPVRARARRRRRRPARGRDAGLARIAADVAPWPQADHRRTHPSQLG